MWLVSQFHSLSLHLGKHIPDPQDADNADHSHPQHYFSEAKIFKDAIHGSGYCHFWTPGDHFLWHLWPGRSRVKQWPCRLITRCGWHRLHDLGLILPLRTVSTRRVYPIGASWSRALLYDGLGGCLWLPYHPNDTCAFSDVRLPLRWRGQVRQWSHWWYFYGAIAAIRELSSYIPFCRFCGCCSLVQWLWRPHYETYIISQSERRWTGSRRYHLALFLALPRRGSWDFLSLEAVRFRLNCHWSSLLQWNPRIQPRLEATDHAIRGHNLEQRIWESVGRGQWL